MIRENARTHDETNEILRNRKEHGTNLPADSRALVFEMNHNLGF